MEHPPEGIIVELTYFNLSGSAYGGTHIFMGRQKLSDIIATVETLRFEGRLPMLPIGDFQRDLTILIRTKDGTKQESFILFTEHPKEETDADF